MMYKSENKFKNFNKTCCLLTDEGLSDTTESSLTNNASSACSSGTLMSQSEEITNYAF